MAIETKHFKSFSIVDGDIKVKVDLSRFEEQYREAQWYLDNQIMQDMKPYMPFGDGKFYNVTAAQSASIAGSGMVIAGTAPMGRFLYHGKVMVDEETGSPWARKGAKKVLVAKYGGKTDVQENLTFSNPKATPYWFETAKDKHGDEWIKEVKRIAGGG